VLDRIETKAVHAGLGEIPAAPTEKLLVDLGIGEVHVGTHEVVVVAVIGVVHVLVPVLAVEEEHGRAPLPLVPVGAMEAMPVPPEVRIAALAPRKGEVRPRRDEMRLGDELAAIGRIALRCEDALAPVGTHAMVEHDVAKRLHPRVPERTNRAHVLVLGAVLGGNGALLVKLAEVVEVVDAIAHVIGPGLALVGGG